MITDSSYELDWENLQMKSIIAILNESKAPTHRISAIKKRKWTFQLKASNPLCASHWEALISIGKSYFTVLYVFLPRLACLITSSSLTQVWIMTQKNRRQVLIVDGKRASPQWESHAEHMVEKSLNWNNFRERGVGVASSRVKTIKKEQKSWQIREEIWVELICFGVLCRFLCFLFESFASVSDEWISREFQCLIDFVFVSVLCCIN